MNDNDSKWLRKLEGQIEDMLDSMSIPDQLRCLDSALEEIGTRKGIADDLGMRLAIAYEADILTAEEEAEYQRLLGRYYEILVEPYLSASE